MNEEEGIGLTIGEFNRFLTPFKPSFLTVDGNSKDNTADVARNMGSEVIFQKAKGKGDAIGCALEHLQNDAIDYVVLTDADFTYPAEYVSQMVDILEKNPQIGMVCGNRFNSRLPCNTGGNLFYLGNKFLSFAHNLLNGIELKDPLTGLRVMRWSALKDWKPKSNSFDIEVELNHYIERQNFGIIEVDIPYRARIGQKKLKVRHGLVILNRIFKECF
jgi:glycosyltransferase involved in cell wall biosynthesis